MNKIIFSLSLLCLSSAAANAAADPDALCQKAMKKAVLSAWSAMDKHSKIDPIDDFEPTGRIVQDGGGYSLMEFKRDTFTKRPGNGDQLVGSGAMLLVKKDAKGCEIVSLTVKKR